MRDCYDSLLSAAAATANSAYGKSLLLLITNFPYSEWMGGPANEYFLN